MRAFNRVEKVKRLNGFDLGFLAQPYLDDHPQYNATDFVDAVHELRKFFVLPMYENGPIAAMSHKVDKLWHLFITHTPQYESFCNDVYGEFLHHQPRSETYSVPAEAIRNFYVGYPKHFGTVPPVWFEDIPEAHVIAVSRGEVPLAVRELKWSGWPGWSS